MPQGKGFLGDDEDDDVVVIAAFGRNHRGIFPKGIFDGAQVERNEACVDDVKGGKRFWFNIWLD